MVFFPLLSTKTFHILFLCYHCFSKSLDLSFILFSTGNGFVREFNIYVTIVQYTSSLLEHFLQILGWNIFGFVSSYHWANFTIPQVKVLFQNNSQVSLDKIFQSKGIWLILKKKLLSLVTKLTGIFISPLCVCCAMKILFLSVLEKLPSHSLIVKANLQNII